MKLHTLPVKRRPAQKGLLRRLSAVTTRRKQHVAATADDMDLDDGSSKISRALTIIFLIHIVAIGLIFVHKNFLDGHTPGDQKAAATSSAAKDLPAVAAPAPRRTDVPRLSSGEKPYIVRAGDNYTRIAVAEGVDESELRRVNEHVDIGPGLILKIPPKRPVAPQMAASIGDAMAPTGSNELVDAVDVTNAPRATLVRGKIAEQPKAATKPSANSGKSHVVQNGESIWKIANRYKVSQTDLMKANGIADARKIKAGMNLTIP